MSHESTQKAATCTALNILDGMNHHKNWECLQAAWEYEGMGFLEFCLWIAELATFSESELVKGPPQDFPGTYDYEVSYEVGAAITEFVRKTDRLPNETEWKQMLTDAKIAFFNKES